MKLMTLFLLLAFAISCNQSDDFYIGKWELNEENDVSTITLSVDNKYSWDFMGNKLFADIDFKAVNVDSEKYDILIGHGSDRRKITMEKLSDNQCIGCTYKIYINENMIDEVFIARKDQHFREPFPKPDNEVIILPNNYEGDFFIIYQNRKDNQQADIKINKKGIGINQGELNLRQLYNTNRTFRFIGHDKDIAIANPDNYSDKKIDSIYKDEEFIVIQKGINQSGRKDWNRENNENIPNNLNVEYFELKRNKNSPTNTCE
jgi:hypothetical protein